MSSEHVPGFPLMRGHYSRVRVPDCVDFPALQAPRLLRILCRKPLEYRIVAQSGSHRKLESDEYPNINFAWHDNQEIPPGQIRRLLCGRVGLTEKEAISVIKGRRKGWPDNTST